MTINLGSPNTDTGIMPQSPFANSKYAITEKEKQIKNGTIFSGAIKNPVFNNAEQVKEKFKTQAQKLIANQFKSDSKVTDTLKSIEDQIKQLEADADEIKGEIDDLSAQKTALMDSYGIDPDSEEEKQVELLLKAESNPNSLNLEERKQLKEMGDLTDYQLGAVAIGRAIAEKSSRLQSTYDQIDANRNALEKIKLESVKSHAMVDAQEVAKDLLAEGDKQVIATVIKDAMDEMADKTEKENETTDDSSQTDTTENKETSSAEKQTEKTLELEEQYKSLQNAILTDAHKALLTDEDTLGIMVDVVL